MAHGDELHRCRGGEGTRRQPGDNHEIPARRSAGIDPHGVPRGLSAAERGGVPLGGSDVSKRNYIPRRPIIYLMQFRGGLLKVGKTVEWDQRKRRHGDTASEGCVDHILIEVLKPSLLSRAEQVALASARRALPTAQRNEWFLGYAHDLLPDVVEALQNEGIEHALPEGPMLERISEWPSPLNPGDVNLWVGALGLGEKTAARLLGVDVDDLRRMNREGAPPHMRMACWMIGWRLGLWHPTYVYPWERAA